MRVIIAGADGALGQAVLDRYRGAGDQVAALSRRPVEGRADEALIPAGDLADERQADAAVGRAVSLLGGVDAYVHLIGAFAWERVEDGTVASWRTMFEANVGTAVSCVRALLPHMARGSIVFIGAQAAQRAAAGFGAYAASKSGVARLTEALAEETGAGIRVNAVLPLIIDTPRNRADMPDADPSRWTSPAAIADAIHFLTTDAARAINGALVPVTHPA
ncbi:hypothetical protein ASD67_17445 [Sphingopyxis sp. Root1497]|uniref:SDR family oxidoreductase n=1 Tax=Sphingopyxis sp. Root1497 TaxID=1736474 RepID=UPI0006FFB6D0|nr:SDR family NAD(P)-dependent oxidoreductase [Sphingopyxis sp. Root1497]KQZ61063.1 hypothetical protein ASD67_17445 [Sphingopyxis sp. Root1497]